ncbi:MAG: SocA family protein [Victivallaceae bacterium]|nr:SocA family protein [Victivallaceae bacterium]
MRFEYKKATQALNYFARKNSSHKISKLKVLKLIYLADRFHLRKYGRAITNDNYIAMQFGPVASGVKDIAEQTIFLDKEIKCYAEICLSQVDLHHDIKSRREVDTDVFSETEIEALDVIWERFHKQQGLVDFTHEFPEWKKHESNLNSNMSLEDFFELAPKGVEYCDVPDDILQLNKEHFQESSQLDEIWR